MHEKLWPLFLVLQDFSIVQDESVQKNLVLIFCLKNDVSYTHQYSSENKVIRNESNWCHLFLSAATVDPPTPFQLWWFRWVYFLWAGVSITVTSITDFVAFMISATTALPALESFCVYSAFGVLALYVLQVIGWAMTQMVEKKQPINNHSKVWREGSCALRCGSYPFKIGLYQLALDMVTIIAVPAIP